MRNKRLLRTLSAFCLTMVVAFGFTIPAFAQGSEQAPAAPAEDSTNAVSYTHLDVYKRQPSFISSKTGSTPAVW